MSVQGLILDLHAFWAGRGCYLAPSYDLEVGAGTMTPDTFFRVLDGRPWKVGYVQPSRRPKDGRYAENPNRVQKHFQYQVIMKPSPSDIQEMYLGSLAAIGVNLEDHDLRFDEDNWESPTIGAWGVGWQVLLDGLEITQFTYFQQCGGIDLSPVPVEITYGLDRLEMFLEQKENIYDLDWSTDVSYRDLRFREEREFSEYNFSAADVAGLRRDVRPLRQGGRPSHPEGPSAAGLRHVSEVLPRLQPSRLAGSHQRHGEGQDDRSDPRAGQRRRSEIHGRKGRLLMEFLLELLTEEMPASHVRSGPQ